MSDFMIIGELYLVKELFWFLCPTKELADDRTRLRACVGAVTALKHSKWLSERYNCNVSFFEPKTYVVLLEESKDCYKLLDCNGNIGWIYCWDFSKYFELVKAKQ